MLIAATLEEKKKKINALVALAQIDCTGIDCIHCPLQRRFEGLEHVCISDVATSLLKQNGIERIEKDGD